MTGPVVGGVIETRQDGPRPRRPWGHAIKRALGLDPTRPRIGAGADTAVLSGTGINNGDVLIGPVDVSPYRSVSVQFVVAVAANQAPQVMFSNDAANWVVAWGWDAGRNHWYSLSNQLTNTITNYPVLGKFMKVVMAGTAANPITATALLSSQPFPEVPTTNLATYSGTGSGSLVMTAAADGLNTGLQSFLQTLAVPHLYNPGATNSDRMRANFEQTLLASGARSSNSNSPDQTNYNHRGILLNLNVTAVGTGTLTMAIKGKSQTVNAYLPTLLTSAALPAAVASYAFRIYPGLTPVANLTVSDILPRLWRAEFTGDGSSWTYSLDAQYML